MALKKGNEIATIDVALVTLITKDAEGALVDEIALNTASKIGVTAVIETVDSVKLIVKGVLIAQKPAINTVTGNAIVLTDNVFNPTLVKIFQGGTITMGTDGKENKANKVIKYAPPVAGSTEKGEVFELCVYSAIYNMASIITGYEKITYPNCQGVPVAINSEDNVFRVPEYTINSSPNMGESPYVIEYVDALPVVTNPTLLAV